jgi:penicillin-binding protein 1A
MKKVTGGALPAQAWHEFMVAAHEGVPVARLPGSWTPTPQTTPGFEDAVSDAIAGTEQPVPQPARQKRTVETVEAAGGFELPRQDAPTASIRRPVPPAEVGGPTVKRQTSILDIILGN